MAWLVLTAAILLAGIELANAAGDRPTPLRRVGGQGAVSATPLETVASFRIFFEQRPTEVARILDLAAWPGDPADLMDAILDGEVEEMEVPIGGHIPWMAGRRASGDFRIASNLSWQGPAPLPAYVIRFESNGSRWAFLFPKACGNLSLYSRMGTSEIKLVLGGGDIRLTDPEGREVPIAADGSLTVTATPMRPQEAPRQGATEGTATELEVAEGTVEFLDYRLPIAVEVEGGNSVTRAMNDSGEMAISVSPDNSRPTRIRVGDAVGVISPGTDLSAGWSPPECRLEVRANDGCLPGSVRIDASGSSVAGGRVTSLEVTVEGPGGETMKLAGEPNQLVLDRILDEAGQYRFSAVVVSDQDRRSVNDCRVVEEFRACVPPPPTADISISAARIEPGERLGLDASGSRSDGGQVTRVVVEIAPEGGRTLSTVELAPPFTGEINFERRGGYRLRAVAHDDFGQISEVAAERRVLVEGGREVRLAYQIGHTSHADEDDREVNGVIQGFGVDLLHRFDSGTSVGFGLGVSFDPSNELDVFLDAKADWRWSKGSYGGGFGLWQTGGSSEPNLSLNAAFDLPWNLRGLATSQLFAEGRAFLGDLFGDSSAGDGYVLSVGFRIGSRAR